MFVASRRIRSAGRTSGSIEITLPADLQVLGGLDCRLTLRDGPLPEIALQPDVSAAQTLFVTLWQKLRIGLEEIDDLGDFSSAEFALALFPPTHWQERPPLAYSDALNVIQEQAAGEHNGSGAEARLLTFLAVVASHRLGLSGSLALAFGDAVAYLMTGASTGLGTDFERGMAQLVFWNSGETRSLGSPLDDHVWRAARAGLRSVYEQFRRWQEDSNAYATAREQWYRALTMQMGGRVSAVHERLHGYK